MPRLPGVLTRRTCSHGHDLMGDNRYLDGKCKKCYQGYFRSYKLRKKEKSGKISIDKPSGTRL